MSSFLINPYVFPAAAGGYDPDAADYISRVETADGQALEASVKDLINDLFVGVKADGNFGALKACCIMAGARTLAGALVPLLSSMPAPTNLGFVAGDYDRKTGLKNTGTKYLDTNRNNNADPQDNQHQAVYITDPPSTGSAKIYIGAGVTNAGTTHLVRDTPGNFGSRNRNSTVSNVTAAVVTGFAGHSRASSSSYTIRANGTSYGAGITSQTPYNANVFVFSTNPASLYSDARLSYYSIGESLDLALLDARVSTFMSSLAALSL